MQSRRVWLPRLTGPLPAVDIFARDAVVVAEPSGVAAHSLGWRPSTVVIGPEGGFSASELAAAPALIELGRSILRIETAAIVAASKFLT